MAIAAPPPTVRQVSKFPAMRAVAFESSDPALQDLVFLNSISAELATCDGEGPCIVAAAAAVFQQVEAELNAAGMSKSHIVDVKTTIYHMRDLIKFNELYDAWMSTVEVLPAQTACQLLAEAESPPNVHLAMSVTATTAAKEKLSSVRAGGGEAEAMFPSDGCDYEPQPMHFPWSPVVRAGSVTWIAGVLDVGAGPEASARQAAAVLKHIDDRLAEDGLSKDSVFHLEIIAPEDLSLADFEEIQRLCVDYLGPVKAKVSVVRPVKTCAACKVEISCVASRSPACVLCA